MQAAVADATQPLGSLPILETAERHAILRTWNDTTQPVPAATLPALFAAQASRTYRARRDKAQKKPQGKDGPSVAQAKPKLQRAGLRYPMKVNE